jgi:hypothetical protein
MQQQLAVEANQLKTFVIVVGFLNKVGISSMEGSWIPLWAITRIPTGSYLYLIDIGNEGLNTNANKQGRNFTRIHAHLLSTIKKTISLLAYQRTRNFLASINF